MLIVAFPLVEKDTKLWAPQETDFCRLVFSAQGGNVPRVPRFGNAGRNKEGNGKV